MSHKNFVVSLSLTLLISFSIPTFSQNKVSGSITDEEGSPLVGVTVQLKTTSTTTITDSKGYYSLEENKGFPWTLVISYAGLQTKEVKVSRAGDYNIQLANKGVLQNITILGTRGKPRSDVNRPVPVLTGLFITVALQ